MTDPRHARLNRVLCPKCGRELMSPTLDGEQLLARHRPDCRDEPDSGPRPVPRLPGVAIAHVRSGSLGASDLTRVLIDGLRATDRVGTQGDSVVAVIEGGVEAARAALDRVLSVHLDGDLEVKLLPPTDPSYAEANAVRPDRAAPATHIPERRRPLARPGPRS